MTNTEKYNNLTERLATLKSENDISNNENLEIAQMILKHVKEYMQFDNPELPLNILIVTGLEDAEDYIKLAENKNI